MPAVGIAVYQLEKARRPRRDFARPNKTAAMVLALALPTFRPIWPISPQTDTVQSINSAYGSRTRAPALRGLCPNH